MSEETPQVEMPKYKCHKIVGARPMTLGDYNKYRGWDIPENEVPDTAGYLVEYAVVEGEIPVHPDHLGYISWSPAEQFESGYTPYDPNESADSPQEEASEPTPAGAIKAIQKAVDLIDPRGKRHIPSGDPGIYNEVLEVLYGVLDSEEAEQEEG